jgi:hypothetical protein
MFKKMFLFSMVFIMCTGCMEVVTTDQMNTLTGNVKEVMLAVDDMQEAVTNSEIIDHQELIKLNEETDRVQEQVAALAKALEESGDVTTLEQAKVIAEAVRPFNPYANETQIALAIATALAAWVARRNNKKTEEVTAKYKAHKDGAEKFMRSNPEKEIELYDDIGEARVRNGVGIA